MITTTTIIIAVTVLISLAAMQKRELMDKLIFYPPAVTDDKQYYRFITSGFIHADFMHLAFNMFTFYFFGRVMETVFEDLTGNRYMFVIFYLTAIIISDIPSYLKNRNNYQYRSLGASGGVSAVVFSFILFAPWTTIYVFVLPIPAILYALLFIFYSIYMGKKAEDNVNHDAHLWGALYGIVFTLIMEPRVINIFLQEIQHPSFHF
ncbi:rhomboid family intramembrane serine protease [soil metagenome]